MGIEQKAVIRITAEQAEALKLISDLQKQLQTDFRSIANDAKKMSGDVNGEMDKMGKSSSALGRTWGKLKGAWLEIMAAVAAAHFLKSWAMDSIAAEEASNKLRIQIGNLGIAYKDVEGSIDASIKAASKYAIVQEEDVSAALQQLLFITGDLQKSQENLNLVYDLAYMKGISVSDAAMMIGKALTGNSEQLGRIMPEFRNLDEVLGSNRTKAQEAAYGMTVLADKVAGASTQMTEHERKVKQAHKVWRDITQYIGGVVIFVFDGLVKGIKGWQVHLLEGISALTWISDKLHLTTGMYDAMRIAVDETKKELADMNNFTYGAGEATANLGKKTQIATDYINEITKAIEEEGEKAKLSNEQILAITKKVTKAIEDQGDVSKLTASEKAVAFKKINNLIQEEIKQVQALTKTEKESNKEREKVEEDYVAAVKKLESEKRKEILANQNEILKNLKETLTLAEKAYETYKAEVIRIQKEIKSTLAGDTEFLTSLNRKFLSDSKKASLERLDSERVLAEAKEAYAQGDLERAKELFETAKEGYKNLEDYAESESTKFAGTNIKIKDEVVKGYTAAAEGLQDVLSAQSDLAASGMEDAAKLAADTQTKFDDLQNQIEELKRIDKEIEMEILVKGYEEALAKKEELEKATSSTHTIYTMYAGQNAPSIPNDADFVGPPSPFSEGGPIKAAGGRHFSGYGGGDRIPILGEAGEYMMRKESVRSWGKGLFDMLNSVNPSAGIRGLSNASGASSGAMDKLAVDLNLGGKTFGMTTDKSTGQDFASQIKRLNILRGRYKQPY